MESDLTRGEFDFVRKLGSDDDTIGACAHGGGGGGRATRAYHVYRACACDCARFHHNALAARRAAYRRRCRGRLLPLRAARYDKKKTLASSSRSSCFGSTRSTAGSSRRSARSSTSATRIATARSHGTSSSSTTTRSAARDGRAAAAVAAPCSGPSRLSAAFALCSCTRALARVCGCGSTHANLGALFAAILPAQVPAARRGGSRDQRAHAGAGQDGERRVERPPGYRARDGAPRARHVRPRRAHERPRPRRAGSSKPCRDGRRLKFCSHAPTRCHSTHPRSFFFLPREHGTLF